MIISSSQKVKHSEFEKAQKFFAAVIFVNCVDSRIPTTEAESVKYFGLCIGLETNTSVVDIEVVECYSF